MSSPEDKKTKSEPALKLSMREIDKDLKSVPPGPAETAAAANPIIPRPAPTGVTPKEATVKDPTVKDPTVKDAAEKDDSAKDDEAPPISEDGAPISLSDISLAVSEVKMPSLPPGVARPSAPPAARAASRPPPPVPTRKSTVPPPNPIAAPKTPSSKPPPQHRSAAWEHDDASAPMISTTGTPLPVPGTTKPQPTHPSMKPSAPPPARPRPPPRPPVVEEIEAEPDVPSTRASLPAPAAAPASSSRGWMIGAALIAAGTVAYVLSPSRDRQAQPPPVASATVSAEPSATAPPQSPEMLIADFDAAIIDGDLDRASLLADKLGVLAEKDPRVLVRQGRVAVIKADRAWLAERLVASDAGVAAATTDDAAAQSTLAELTTKANALTLDALAAAPEDMQAILARIDALRIAGTPDAADALVIHVIAKRTDPDVAYTLGARDFAAAKPQLVANPPPGLVDLQIAAAANPRLARPQALLAFLLANRGELDAAREMSKGLETPAHPNPLLEPLRAYIASRPPSVASSSTNRTSSYVTAPTSHPTDTAEPPPDEPAAPVAPPMSPAQLVAAGDAARAKGDRGAAQTFYTRALAAAPGNYAALLGLADIEWETGSRNKAVTHYTQIKERFPNAPPRVEERLSQ
jgi:tetratricopeptide (TPR) repeat protein